MITTNSPVATESAYWRRHFLAAATKADRVPWNDPAALSRDESRCIQSSIRQFQLGEGSSGKRLLQRGRVLANLTADPDCLEALALFVKEEQRHSGYLLRFMQREGIPAASSRWVDTVFRRLRVLAGLELSLRVLVSAEIIAFPYYRALAAATQSVLLQAICYRILQDEAAHLRFQASMLSRISAARPWFAARIVCAIHQVFLLITCGAVWRAHGRVFCAAGYSHGGFLAEALWEFDRLDNAVGRGPVRACIPVAPWGKQNPEAHNEHDSSLERTKSAMVKSRN
jgi:hypothetical protein